MSLFAMTFWPKHHQMRDPKNIYVICAFMALSLTSLVCAQNSENAVVKHFQQMEKGALFSVDELHFPLISLGSVHTETIHVRGLSFPTYIAGTVPRSVTIKLPESEGHVMAAKEPWKTAKCRIQMKSIEGKTFYDQIVEFGRDWDGSYNPVPSEAHTQEIFIGLPKLSEAGLYQKMITDYDIVVEVISPSMRVTDSFQFLKIGLGGKRLDNKKAEQGDASNRGQTRDL